MKRYLRKFLIAILFIMFYFVVNSKVEAAGSIALSSNKQTVNVGDTFSVSVNLSGAQVATLTVRLTIDNEKIDYISGPSNSNFSGGKVIYTWTDPNGGTTPLTGGTIATFTFKAKSAGTANFNVSGNFYSPDEIAINPSFSGTSVSVKNVETTNNQVPNNPSTNNNSGVTNTNQNTNPVPTKPNSNVNTNQNTNNGASNLNTQNKKDNVTQSKSSNANLKSLRLDVEGISPIFDKNITQYYLTIPNEISNISVIAEAEEQSANVQVSGNTEIQNGTSQIKISVTAEDGTIKEYVVDVTKTDNPELTNTNLENLAIENISLIPEFSAEITEYNADLNEDKQSVNILAVPQIEGAQVVIEGNENLQIGENIIRIIVTAKDGQTTKIYTIKLNKKDNKQLEQDIENKVKDNNWITFFAILFVIIVISIVIYFVSRKK